MLEKRIPSPARNAGFYWDFLAAWRPWAENLQGEGLACGHWLTEERPRETADALLAFFGEGN